MIFIFKNTIFKITLFIVFIPKYIKITKNASANKNPNTFPKIIPKKITNEHNVKIIKNLILLGIFELLIKSAIYGSIKSPCIIIIAKKDTKDYSFVCSLAGNYIPSFIIITI